MTPGTKEVRSGPRHAGYRYGLRQPATTFSLQLECPPHSNFQMLDEWLQTTFQIELGSPPETAPGSDGSAQAAVSARSWRVMHLGAELLRALRIPAFDPGRVLEVRLKEQESSTWIVKIAVPCIDHVPEKYVVSAYDHAAKVSRWLLGTVPTPENAEILFAYLQRNFIDPLKGGAVGGESTIPLLRAAWSKDIPFRHLRSGTYQLGWGKNSLRVTRGAIQFDSAIGAALAQDKWAAAGLLRDAGLPAPVNMLANSEKGALSAAQTIGWPVVVKPLNRDRGEGVTVSVASELQLAEAFRKAASFSKQVIIEREVAGICHRVLVAQDKVHVVSKRLPKSVKGDGEKTIKQLLQLANDTEMAKPPWSRLKPFPLDAIAMECLAALGLTADSVPYEGQFVPLRQIQSTEAGGVVENMIDVIHPDNVAIAIKAARLFDLSLAGIDIISSDIGRPWHENGAIINEVNYSSLLPRNSTDSVLPALLGQYITLDGRIPVHVVMGGESAFDIGLRMRAMHAERGIQCYLTSHATTVSADGDVIALAGQSLFERCNGLMLDSQVGAIVAVIQTDELLRTGLPFDRIDSITVNSIGRTDIAGEVGGLSDEAWMEPMIKMLKQYEATDKVMTALHLAQDG